SPCFTAAEMAWFVLLVMAWLIAVASAAPRAAPIAAPGIAPMPKTGAPAAAPAAAPTPTKAARFNADATVRRLLAALAVPIVTLLKEFLLSAMPFAPNATDVKAPTTERIVPSAPKAAEAPLAAGAPADPVPAATLTPLCVNASMPVSNVGASTVPVPTGA